MIPMDPSPVCLHKGGRTYESRVGIVCPFCGCIRHRHSVLELVPAKRIGDIVLYDDIAVPLKLYWRRDV